jgi:SnoaL-like domain
MITEFECISCGKTYSTKQPRCLVCGREDVRSISRETRPIVTDEPHRTTEEPRLGSPRDPIKPVSIPSVHAAPRVISPPSGRPPTAPVRAVTSVLPVPRIPRASASGTRFFAWIGGSVLIVLLAWITISGLLAKQPVDNNGPRVNEPGRPFPPKPLDVSSITTAVMSTLDGWVTATKAGNVDNCMSFFADRLDSYYSLRNVGSDKVRSDLMKAFSNYSTFDVQLSNVDITTDQNGTTATATFDKTFNFQGPKYYSGKVQQRMWFANQDGRWRIVGLKELKTYSKDSGIVADGSGGATDTSTGSQGTTPQPPTVDANAYRIRQEALARDYWQRADRLLQQRQYSAAVDICNQGLAAVPGNNALLQKKNEIERALSDVAGNSYGQTPPQQPTLKRRSSEDSPQQPTLKRRSSDDSQVQMPSPRPTPPVYQGPRQGVITRSVVIEQNELISVGDELPGVPVIVQSVEPRDQVGIVESPGPSNQWKKLVLRSKKKMHVVISIRWSVL